MPSAICPCYTASLAPACFTSRALAAPLARVDARQCDIPIKFSRDIHRARGQFRGANRV